jgi:glycosyltransferase involved in cell wall biosynthesis
MSVSICIPTYNRKKFEKLIQHNINIQTYYNIQEVIILDDGDDEPLSIKTKYPIKYYNVPRCSIGDKRNMLVSLSQCDYVAMMDTDDMYDKDYIGHSIFEMETNDKSIAGSADMLVYSKGDFYKQRCLYLHYLNEATLVFKKSIWSPFNSTNSNEAIPFLEKHLGNIIETNIDRLMCCIAHDHNTIPKKQWLVDQYKTPPLSQYSKHIEVLSSLNV